MKVELNLEEINEAIALYLRERKLSSYTQYEITDIEYFIDELTVTTVTAVIGQRNDTPQPAPCPVPAAPRAY
ncbi:hypothetical protein SIPHO054v2_p0031 [Vibrio phage 103E44.1]|nr:hypothetical protein SIPHO054v2_p0031 [Vibrio phage 103E44.1]QZI87885.1 hypothetical protein SIPHO055v2_p0030 [Vibrio phage 104E43.1]